MGINKKLALQIIMGISAVGILFSGYLSYSELFSGVCPVGGCGNSLLGLPVCVYGLIMYTAVFIVALLGYRNKD